MAIRGRQPVIALDYSDKYKAVEKELMIDYNTGNIYVVSATDRTIIFDITSKIAEQIEGLSGQQVVVNIEGIGDVNLTDYLNKIQVELENSVQVIDTSTEATYVGKDKVLDDRSIDTTDSLMIQVKGFDSAEDLQIPTKKNGVLVWVDLGEIAPSLGDSSTSGNPTIIPPSNPYDGDELTCLDIAPVNNTIYLRASKRQRTINLASNCTVILPETLDQYSEIQWYIVTNNFAPQLSWQNNLIWKDNTRNLPANSSIVFRAQTWDGGVSWLAYLDVYNASMPSTGVDQAYLENNYYNKNQTDDKFVSNDQITQNYYNKSEIDKNFTNTSQLKQDYYNKQDIDSFLSFDKYNNSNTQN